MLFPDTYLVSILYSLYYLLSLCAYQLVFCIIFVVFTVYCYVSYLVSVLYSLRYLISLCAYQLVFCIIFVFFTVYCSVAYRVSVLYSLRCFSACLFRLLLLFPLAPAFFGISLHQFICSCDGLKFFLRNAADLPFDLTSAIQIYYRYCY